ncbi:hypothetical protein A9179_06170 [Pseudomonas alcaligenes]|uniref:Flagellar hook-associated protein n=1 Tax=Aquipseudomonas alcaligenes TaxID=43263 RepID=A0ABR7S051_AQUAC|nr:hypothetical protein [Pseudomonas alcaligenes]MBC9249858.1 hypothetical protein [Pseudomonas alcaligenes]
MKVEKPLSAIAALDPQERRQAVLRDAPVPRARQAESSQNEVPQGERTRSKGAGFNLQLNQQLSSMQSAQSYLDDLSGRLRQLKLSLSRELTTAQSGGDKEALQQAMQQVNQLLEQRSQRSANTLDANLKLRLNEPVRSRFSLQGLESLQNVQESGRETLLFSAGRQSSEPIAVVLDDNLSPEQVLRRFNAGLGQLGIRAELEQGGALKFSARESDWQELKGQLSVQGEDKLFTKTASQRVQSTEEQLLSFPAELNAETYRELRRMLDSVVAALDKVGAVRDQLNHRQQEIREFLARQADSDERQWAADYANSVFNLMNRAPSSYSAVTQTVVAQANISRFAVVSLLS